MTTKYVVVKFKFDMARFSQCLKSINPGDLSVFAEIIGVTPATLRTWSTGGISGTYVQPAMGTFLAACNALDLDPRGFFILE